jgi:uncharacterized repeat protein (TIGR01451 family)
MRESARLEAEALFNNGGFEQGGGSLTGWTVSTFLNANGLTVVPPASVADLNLNAGGTNFTFSRTNAVPSSQLFSGMAASPGTPPRWPRFDTTSVVINEQKGANSTNANSLKQQYAVTNADVDPADNKVHVRFVLAPALQAAGHVPAQQPYFFIILRNLTTSATLYTNFNYANSPGVPWKSQGTGNTAVLYTDWTIFDVAPGNVALRVGDNIELEIFASRCQPSGHFGEVYVDGFGSKFPGLSVSKVGPQAANIDSDITYNFTVENNTTGIAPNVQATETLPYGTTFVSAAATSPGASCSTLPVGSTGTITCSFGYMNAGAIGSFTVTVHAFAPVATGSGTATSATATTLTDTGKAWAVNAFAGYTLYLVGGQGVGQYRTILSNTANTLTISANGFTPWATTPNATTQYKIINPPLDIGTRTSSGNGPPPFIADSSKTWADNQWVGATVTVLSSGTANQVGQQRLITLNDPTTLDVDTNWTNNPNGATVKFAIAVPPDKVVNGNYTVSGQTVSSLIGPRVETVMTAGVLYTDVAIAVSDGVPAVVWGGSTTYAVIVTNNGPLAVTGATVTDTFPAQLTGVTWTCVRSGGGGSCGSGSGNINQTVDLAVGQTATFTVNASIVSGSGSGSVNDVASVAVPAAMTDQNSLNNTDNDVDGIGTLLALNLTKPMADSGRGTVTSSPAAISCGTGCFSANASFLSGTVVTLTAVARPGDTFAGWQGDCSGGSTQCTLTVDAVKNVSARFNGPAVTGTAGVGGTVSCSPANVLQGTNASCTVAPGVDYDVLTLTDNGVSVLGSLLGGTYTLNNVTADHTVAATFNHKPNITTTASTTAAAGTAYSYAPAATDPDGPGPLAWTAAAGDTCGGAVNGASGAYSFTPGPAASCVVGVSVCDAAAPPACRVQLTTVTINHAPVPTGDALTTSPNAAKAVAAATLASNDSAGGPASEQASQTLTVTAVSASSGQGGTVSLAGGIVTYTPPAGFAGTDTFTYTVTDNGTPALSAMGTVTVTVVNVAPIITSTAPPAATEAVAYTYNATSTDIDGPAATWSLGAANTCAGSIDAATGAFTFTPAGPTPPPSCVVSVRVCDGGVPNQCVTQSTTVTITAINDPPVITSTASTTATEAVLYTYSAAESDPDGPTSGSWSLGAGDTCGGSIAPATGIYTFTPPGPTPPASCVVSVKVCDGGAPNQCTTQTTTVTVTSVNDAPVITSTAPTSATEAVPYTYAATESDPDGPTSGTWSVGAGDTCGGSIAPATGVYTFTPAGPTPPASCVAQVRVCDGATPSLCATQTTTVTIASVNGAPVITSAAPTGATEAVLYTYSATESDPDGPTSGTWSLGAGDTCGGSIGPSSGVYTFTPAGPTPPASCVVSVKVCDGGAPNLCATQTTTVSISSVNDAPLITSTAPTAAIEGSPFHYAATVADPDGPMPETWSVGAADTCAGTINASTGAYAFTPMGPVPPASCVVSVRVCDSGTPSLCATQTTTVTIMAVNDPPIVTSVPPTVATEDTPYAYTPVESDPDGPGGTWSVGPGDTCGGMVDPITGKYTFVPTGPTPPSSCVVSISVCDGGTPNQCATQTTTVAITAVNDAPMITSTAPSSATSMQQYRYPATASDPDGPAPLTWSVGSGDTCGGVIDAATGVYTFTPTGPNLPPTCAVSVQVCDGATPVRCATQTATVTVFSVNQPPAITSAAPGTATEGQPYAYSPMVMDADGPGETWSKGTADTCGGTVDPNTGAYHFTPMGPTPPASCVVQITVCDGGTPNLCVTQTTTVTIAAVNDPPSITSQGPTQVRAGDAYTYTATATDPDGPSTQWSLGPNDTCGGTIDATRGAYTFTPPDTAPPPVTCVVSVKVCDGGTPNRCVTQDTTVTISARTNAPPVITGSPPPVAKAGTPYDYSPGSRTPMAPRRSGR